MSCKSNTAMNCPCTASCSRHGKCCECVANHAANGQFPACFFSKEGEKWYDRSYAALMKDRQTNNK